MAAPVTGEFNLAVTLSDPNLTTNNLKITDSAEDKLIFSQLVKMSNSRPESNRKKSKPIRFEVSRVDMQEEPPPPKINIGVLVE